MNYLPSKELLSEVLAENIFSIELLNESMVQYYHSYDFETDIGIFESINIHELAHKCKVWAYKQGYVILSGHSANSMGLFFCSCKGWLSENYDKQIEINHKTEPEAIFKACQWILDNRNNYAIQTLSTIVS